MHRRRYLQIAGAVSTIALTGCIDRSTPEYDVGMSADAFLPAEFVIEVGDVVDWRNTGSRSHTVTAYEAMLPAGATYFASGGYESQVAALEGWQSSFGGALYTGEHYEHRFETSGEFPYYCIPHEGGGMIGTIIVE